VPNDIPGPELGVELAAGAIADVVPELTVPGTPALGKEGCGPDCGVCGA